MLWIALGAIAAEPCEDPERWVARAEGDIASFFLADAEREIQQATDALGCSAPATPALAARLLLATAMVGFLRNEEGAAPGFAAARTIDPAVWSGDYGDKARAAYEAAQPLQGFGRLSIRGLGDGESVYIDGAPLGAPYELGDGPHLVQVGDDRVARFARVLVVAAGDSTQVVVPIAPAVAEAPPPVAEPPVAEPPAVEPPDAVIVAEPFGPPSEGPFVPPFTRTGGRWTDAQATALRWNRDLVPLAAQDPDGERARRRLATNAPAQATAIVVGAASGYAAYLMGWEWSVGKVGPPALTGAGTFTGAALAAACATWEVALVLGRSKRREEIARAAERAAAGGAP
ncbi:MAG: hypothetical protein ACI9K2_005927 [Myxococcota bacterium]|jgi:hypothetical protein